MLMSVAMLGLAQLSIASIRANQMAHSTTIATVLASQKIEQLRALTWTFDAAGTRVSDTSTDTTINPERPTGGTGLTTSPSTSLAQNTSGYCDFLSADGRTLGTGTSPPRGTMYVRRWAVEPMSIGDVLMVRVAVMPVSLSGTPEHAQRLAEEASINSVKARKSG